MISNCSNIMRIDRSGPNISSGVYVYVRSFKLTLQQDIQKSSAERQRSFSNADSSNVCRRCRR